MLISVLIITYQRRKLLEEAMYSFLQQDYINDTELLIINDSPIVKYYFDHPKIRIINYHQRFPSLLEKLKFGFEYSRGDFVYRLDDDDLLTPWALNLSQYYILNNPNYDVYRCQHHYGFVNNIYTGLGNNINNGNCYSKDYLTNFDYDSCSFGEDVKLTFGSKTKVYTGNTGKYTMIYRWGMNTFHVSGWGEQTPENSNKKVDEFIKNHSEFDQGNIILNPIFLEDHYNKIILNPGQ